MEYQHLYETIDENYNTDEMRDLFMDLELDYENVSGSNKRRKAQELQTFMQRRRRLGELIDKIYEDRPFLDLTPYLFEVIYEKYNLKAMYKLFEDLGFGPQKFSEKNRRDKARELQNLMEQQHRLDELMVQMQKDWNQLDLTAFGAPSPEDKVIAPALPDVRTISNDGTITTSRSISTEDDPNYENFDIHIRPGREDGQYALNATSLAGETDAIIYQSLPNDEAYDDQVYYLRELMASPEDAEKLGHTLRTFLFPPLIRDLFLRTKERAESEGKAGVRVRLNIFRESRDLYQIPWEYVRDDKAFMALNEETPIVRYMPTNRSPQDVGVPEKVRILVAWASPSDQELLDVEGEVAVVQEALNPLIESGRVEVQVVEHAQASQLRRAVRSMKPHILHFIGHGILQDSGEGALALEGRDGTTALIDAEKLLVLLQGDDTKLVMLSACQTAATSEDEPDHESARALMGVAPKLVWGGTPAVVAMQFNLPDDAGAPFMETFYEFLANGKPLDTAVTEARIGLYFDFDDQIFWAIPVLFMRAPDGNIW